MSGGDAWCEACERGGRSILSAEGSRGLPARSRLPTFLRETTFVISVPGRRYHGQNHQLLSAAWESHVLQGPCQWRNPETLSRGGRVRLSNCKFPAGGRVQRDVPSSGVSYRDGRGFLEDPAGPERLRQFQPWQVGEQRQGKRRGGVASAGSHNSTGSLDLGSCRPRCAAPASWVPRKGWGWWGQAGAPPSSTGVEGLGRSRRVRLCGGACAPVCSSACVNACVYILLISVSGICILSGLVCWACSLKPRT